MGSFLLHVGYPVNCVTLMNTSGCVVFDVDSLEKVHVDEELQNWGSELCKSKEDGGAGLKVDSSNSCRSVLSEAVLPGLLARTASEYCLDSVCRVILQ